MLFFAKQFNALRPTDDESEGALKKIAQGEIVTLEIKRPRNLPHLRKYWLMCGLIAENKGCTRDAIDRTIKVLSGHVETITTKSRTVESPSSISFAKMGQAEWEEYWERAVKVVCEEIIPGLDSEDLEREVLELVT